MDKKKHSNHFEDSEQHFSNKHRKKVQQEFQEDDLGFDDENDELYLEVKRFLK